jgi:hypothetical protein
MSGRNEGVVVSLGANALERLIAGDDEVKLKLKEGAVKELVGRTVKTIGWTTDMKDQIESNTRAAVEAELTELGFKRGYSVWALPEKSEALRVMRDSINSAVEKETKAALARAQEKMFMGIREQIQEAVDARLNDMRINTIIEQYADQVIAQTLKRVVTAAKSEGAR